MPISKKYLKIFKAMQKQYCTAKYGKAGRKDKKVQGVSSCPKGRQVFYAWANKKGIDYTLSLDELLEFASEGILIDEEE